jgi:hypothetical protein
MKGVLKLLLVDATSLLLTTPAPVATKPFMRVARPMMVDRSGDGSPAAPADEDAEMSHDSKAEKRMEVDTPPSILPKKSVGIEGMVMQTHDRVYVIQNTRQSLRRPLETGKHYVIFNQSC